MRADRDLAPGAPQLDAAQWRMLCAIARDAIAVARERGASTAVFAGYRLVARRVGTDAATAVELTLSHEPPGDIGPETNLRTEVALSFEAGTASVIAWRCACGRAVCATGPSAG